MHHGGHDMSDPRMAAAMEADMRRRFWITRFRNMPPTPTMKIIDPITFTCTGTPFRDAP